ncbi:restriction endonuclease subunit S [Pseudomonas sp. PB103]|uniref:restriction endonuclease subunit S n=1 Tax=Pseudomonas sp. PB103 TaxID=2494698 RepID=UPI00131C4D54|nr:restriction endonuclease subunit S [Pseudomonas sp. PB103]KAE9640433.1 restriction endonuclease subunit S [Pseudomonas sp. PB103]
MKYDQNIVRLCEIAELNPKAVQDLEDQDLVSFLSMAAVTVGGETSAGESRPYSEVNRGYTAFENGDLLIAKITPCFENGKIAQARIANKYGFGSTEFHVVRPDSSQVNSRYLLYFLRQCSVRLAGARKMTGSAGHRRVPISFFSDLQVFLPSLFEQNRISEALAGLDGVRAKCRKALELLSELYESLFFNMFFNRDALGCEYPAVELGQLLKFKSGSFLPASEMSSNGLYPVYGGNGTSGYHDEYMFDDPKIVIGRVGAYCGCVHMSSPFSWVTDNALYVSGLRDGLSVEYVYFALKYANLNQYASKSGQPLVSAGRLSRVKISVPPVEQQQKFVNICRKLDSQVLLQRTRLNLLDSLFLSVQHRAFRGEL